MGLLNYTTKIDPDKTAQEIAKCLSTHGAKAVLTEYDEVNNTVSSISFKIALDGKEISFRLPCSWKPVYEILKKQKGTTRNIWDEDRKRRLESDMELQAVRTAWRIVKDWVEAQMAIVETQMASTTEVFLPYAIGKNGKTMFQHVVENPSFLLGDGK